MSKNYKLDFTRELAKPTLALASRQVMSRAKDYGNKMERLESRMRKITATKSLSSGVVRPAPARGGRHEGIMGYEKRIQKELKGELEILSPPRRDEALKAHW